MQLDMPGKNCKDLKGRGFKPRRKAWQWCCLVVILSKPVLRSEGSGRAARCGALFAPQQPRVWLASLSTTIQG
jgi:hypothetical protein